VSGYQIPPTSFSGFSSPGIPADAPAGHAADEFVLDLANLVRLVAQPDEFFGANPLFHNLCEWTKGALNNLARTGIIKGEVDPKRRGCVSCSRKKLLAFALQLGHKVQQVVLQAEQAPELWAQLGRELHGYVTARGWHGTDFRLVMYARLQTGLIRRVELHDERACPAGRPI
jgi:hypothetical protein